VEPWEQPFHEMVVRSVCGAELTSHNVKSARCTVIRSLPAPSSRLCVGGEEQKVDGRSECVSKCVQRVPLRAK
jgi:hypothetical protein